MPASRPDLALVPRPTKVSSLGGRLTLDRDTAVRALPGAEPAADPLRTLAGRAAGLPLAPTSDGRVVIALDDRLGGLGEEGYGLTVARQALQQKGPSGPDGAHFDAVPHEGAYTKAELRGLVRYAAERGVTVVPEIETRGSSASAGLCWRR